MQKTIFWMTLLRFPVVAMIKAKTNKDVLFNISLLNLNSLIILKPTNYAYIKINKFNLCQIN